MNTFDPTYKNIIKLAFVFPIVIKIVEHYLMNGYDGIFNHLNSQTFLVAIAIIKDNMTYYAIVFATAMIAYAIAYTKGSDSKEGGLGISVKIKRIIKESK